MAKIRLTCPECGKKVAASPELAGRPAKCPNCGAVIHIPFSAWSEAEPEPAEEPAALAAETATDFEAEAFISTPLIAVFDRLLGRLRFLKKRPAAFRRYQRVVATFGVYAILAAAALQAIFATVRAIKEDSLSIILGGLAAMLALTVVHYLAAKFADAGHQFLQDDPHRIASAAFMDCLGLLASLGALAAIVNGVVVGILVKTPMPFLISLIPCFLLAHLAVLCLNPKECLNVQAVAERIGAGESALSILTFLFRCVLVMGPVVLGFCAAGGTVWMMVARIKYWTVNGDDFFAAARAAGESGTALRLVVLAGLVPLAFYLAYMLYMLYVDLCMAIFRIARNTEPTAE